MNLIYPYWNFGIIYYNHITIKFFIILKQIQVNLKNYYHIYKFNLVSNYRNEVLLF